MKYLIKKPHRYPFSFSIFPHGQLAFFLWGPRAEAAKMIVTPFPARRNKLAWWFVSPTCSPLLRKRTWGWRYFHYHTSTTCLFANSSHWKHTVSGFTGYNAQANGNTNFCFDFQKTVFSSFWLFSLSPSLEISKWICNHGFILTMLFQLVKFTLPTIASQSAVSFFFFWHQTESQWE